MLSLVVAVIITMMSMFCCAQTPITDGLGYMKYHNGYLFTQPKVQLIYYGAWAASDTNIIDTFVSTVQDTNYFNLITLTYYQEVM